ncbi:hypothetical protein [Parendozoicomonas haliclonae]|uniref:DNA ligase (NAD(+)) n=1 Tax=Parendozoicomonas haliclonae TaxID=1960125 RepID=A0A1X7ADP8_9GAMM|nr:hypothetical protein [Parendozoicomonas haliclonae]SMA31801.1 DNA ligase B [Parendozoicomonas haliclonae]
MRLLFRQFIPILLLSLLLITSARADSCPDSFRDSSRDTLQQELSTLLNSINHHNDLYEDGRPVITDEEYDALTRRQRLLERCLGLTQTASTPPLDQNHRYPMGSLSKADGPDDIEAFLDNARRLGSPVILQPKIDGIAIELVYRYGKLVQALTRGQRRSGKGIDLMPLIPAISTIPKQLPNNLAEIVLHGELYALTSNEHAKGSASARHYVAGLVNRGSPSIKELKYLKFFPWHWVKSPLGNIQGNNLELEEWGFNNITASTHPVKDLYDVASLRNQYSLKNRMEDIPMDGIVLKLGSTTIQQRLGHLDGTPYWAIAWKFPSTTKATSIKDITWTIGRTGQVTVIVEVEPVTVNGITITRVNIGPEEYFSSQDIAIHDTISVSLKGAATPVHGKVLNRPEHRHHTTVPAQNRFNGMTCLRYSPECKEQFLSRVLWLIGNNGLDMPSVDKRDIQTLIEEGKIHTLADLFTLTEDELPQPALDILKEPQLSLAQSLRALGIPEIGQKRADKLAEKARNWSAVFKTSPEQIQDWLGCSSNKAQMMHDYIHSPEITALAQQLMK